MRTGRGGRGRGSGEPQRVFGPPRGVVIGTIVAALVFAVVLEFLVFISFVGQRLWTDPRLYTSPLFMAPLLIWIAVLLASALFVVRTLTVWLQVDENGFTLRGLYRRTVTGTWADVGRVIAVQDIDRGATPAEMLDAPENAYDGVFVMGRSGTRLLAVSSRLFGPTAQDAVLAAARNAGVQIESIDAIPVKALRRREPAAMHVADRHPGLLLLLGILFYVGHNVLTFWVWGL